MKTEPPLSPPATDGSNTANTSQPSARHSGAIGAGLASAH